MSALRRRVAVAAAMAVAGLATTVALALPGTGAGASPAGTPAAARVASGGSEAGGDDHGHHAQRPQDIVFGPAPDVFPPGAQMAVLQGDPSVAGAIFTVRLRLPDGYVIPPHRHPTDEHVTVIRGTFLVGLGDTVNRGALLPPLKAGGFVSAPANVSHFAIAKGRTEVQVHAIGPFQLTYVHPEDDPRNRS